MKRKHSKSSKGKVPIACEVCDAEVRDKLDLKHHRISHTYTSVNTEFKCEKCDFSGKNGWTMQIHHGKCHGKKLECGICDFQAKSLENLDLHLTTYETYKCMECEFVAKQLSELKKHITENTACGLTKIWHVKMDRNDDKEASYKEYEQKVS